jgi:hypothetical protein
VEFGGELDFGLDLLFIIYEGLVGELDAELVLTSILSFVFVLHVGVHIAVEQLLLVGVYELQAHTLVRCPTSSDHFIVGFDKHIENLFVHDLHFHFQGLKTNINS